MIKSIFGKILASNILIIFVLAFALGLSMYHLTLNHLIDTKRHELFNTGIALTKIIQPALQQNIITQPLLDNLGDLSGSNLWIADKSGQTLYGRAPRRWENVFPEEATEITALFNGTPQSWLHNGRHHMDPSIIIAIPLPETSDKALFLYTPIMGINKNANELTTLLSYVIIISIILTALLSFIISRNITKPLSNISQAAANFASGNYQARATVLSDDEVGQLGSAFNEMAIKLEKIDSNRREFLANVTHDLKTPLAVIQALTETLLDDLVKAPEKKQEYLQKILLENKNMNLLISDLLNLAQLESGQLSFHYEKINATKYLRQHFEGYQSLMKEKNLQLQLTIHDNLNEFFIDQQRLQQVLNNIMSNAIKYSPINGTIAVNISKNKDFLELTITDNGIGITANDLPFIWDRFYKADKSRNRKEGGTGLGLAITKMLVLAMKGTVTVKSTPNVETCFTINLPFKS